MFLCLSEILLLSSCDYFYLVIAKIKIINFWIRLQPSNNCQHAPGYTLQMGFLLEVFWRLFSSKKSYNHESEWVMMVCQPAWSSSLGVLFILKWREMGNHWPYILPFPSTSFCIQITLTFDLVFFFILFFNCNTATLISVVFNSIDSSILPQVSLFFNVPFYSNQQAG